MLKFHWFRTIGDQVNLRERVISAKYITKKWNDVFIKTAQWLLKQVTDGCNVAISLLRLQQRHDKLQTQFCNSFCEIVRVNFRERVISAKYITKKWNDVFIKTAQWLLKQVTDGCNVAISLLRLQQRHDKLQTQFCNSFCEIVRFAKIYVKVSLKHH